MTIRQDKNLIKLIGSEEYKGFKISYSITRFGGLYVEIRNPFDQEHFLKSTENIIEAREFVDIYLEKLIEEIDARERLMALG